MDDNNPDFKRLVEGIQKLTQAYAKSTGKSQTLATALARVHDARKTALTFIPNTGE